MIYIPISNHIKFICFLSVKPITHCFMARKSHTDFEKLNSKIVLGEKSGSLHTLSLLLVLNPLKL
jgi:hypothetical protein